MLRPNTKNELGGVGVAEHDDMENVVIAGPPSAKDHFYYYFKDPDFLLKTLVEIATHVSEDRLRDVAEITVEDVQAALAYKGIHAPKTAPADFPWYDEAFGKRVWKLTGCDCNWRGSWYGPYGGATISISASCLLKMVVDASKNPANFHTFGTLEKLKFLTAASKFETFPLPSELVSLIHCFEGGRLLVLASPTTGVTTRISEYNWIIDDDDNEEDEEEWTLDEENERVGDVEFRWCEDTFLCPEEQESVSKKICS